MLVKELLNYRTKTTAIDQGCDRYPRGDMDDLGSRWRWRAGGRAAEAGDAMVGVRAVRRGSESPRDGRAGWFLRPSRAA